MARRWTRRTLTALAIACPTALLAMPTASGTANGVPTTVTTQASGPIIAGGVMSDTATLTGGVNATGQMTFDVYGPNDPSCADQPAFTSSVMVNGNGPYQSSDFSPAVAGTYQFVATYSGDNINLSASDNCTDPTESVAVGKASTAVTTKASGPVAFGGSISDAATLSGGAAPSGTITFHAFGPGNTTCTGKPVISLSSEVADNGVYHSLSRTPTVAGTYQWVVTYNGDASNLSSTSGCNSPNESTTVSKAKTAITLEASQAKVTFGHEQTERLSVTVSSAGSSPTPTGSVTIKAATKKLCRLNLSQGKGSCTLSKKKLHPGKYKLVATYSGGVDYISATSAKRALTIKK